MAAIRKQGRRGENPKTQVPKTGTWGTRQPKERDYFTSMLWGNNITLSLCIFPRFSIRHAKLFSDNPNLFFFQSHLSFLCFCEQI